MENNTSISTFIILLFMSLLASPVVGKAKTWTQVGQDIDGESAGDNSGYAVSLSADGTILAAGAPENSGNGALSGHVRVYQNQSGTWTQVGEDIDGEATGDQSGCSVSLNTDGSIVAIGAFYNDGNGFLAGHVRVYRNQSDTWIQIGEDIDGETSWDYSGWSVTLSADGTIAAIGAPGNAAKGESTGHVRVYQNQSGTWTQVGEDIDGEAAGDHFGRSVSLNADGTIVAVGAPENSGNGALSGHVRVYQNQSGTWTQVGEDIDGEAAADYSGESVSLSADGTIVAIGAIFNAGSGHVRVYQNQSGTWTQIGADIDGEATGDYFGRSVSLNADGRIVAIGARTNDGNGANSGHMRVYENQSGTWSQIGIDIDGESAGDYFGRSVSLSADGTIVASGARYNDGNGDNSGHVRVFNLRIIADLSGVIRILQAMSGKDTGSADLGEDVSGDGKVGLAEVISILQEISQ